MSGVGIEWVDVDRVVDGAMRCDGPLGRQPLQSSQGSLTGQDHITRVTNTNAQAATLSKHVTALVNTVLTMGRHSVTVQTILTILRTKGPR